MGSPVRDALRHHMAEIGGFEPATPCRRKPAAARGAWERKVDANMGLLHAIRTPGFCVRALREHHAALVVAVPSGREHGVFPVRAHSTTGSEGSPYCTPPATLGRTVAATAEGPAQAVRLHPRHRGRREKVARELNLLRIMVRSRIGVAKKLLHVRLDDPQVDVNLWLASGRIQRREPCLS